MPELKFDRCMCIFKSQVWLCGGSMEVLPCSRVAHIARTKKPYHSNIAFHTRRNALRVAEVWMDQYKSNVYLAWNLPMNVSTWHICSIIIINSIILHFLCPYLEPWHWLWRHIPETRAQEKTPVQKLWVVPRQYLSRDEDIQQHFLLWRGEYHINEYRCGHICVRKIFMDKIFPYAEFIMGSIWQCRS